MLEAVTSDHGEQGTVSLPLPAPLADWRIVATLPGSDPVRSALWRNRTIYIVILAVFYFVIAIGVIVTLRGIWREAHLSRMKTDFVSNLSHELRTPLTSIRMFAETLRMGRATTPEEQTACIDFIAKESERLSDIAERTLDWARLEAGRRPFIRARVSPSRLTKDIVDGFLAHGMLDSDSIRVDVPEDLPEVDVDRAAIGQVLLNLLENAVKYSGPEKHIVVRGRQHRGAVLIEVEDNGIGVARKDLRRIFERFYRVDDLLARRTEGSGLGLSIARRIVNAHDGRLTVQSELGVGSVFTIQLPAAASSGKAAQPAESHA
jgi:signal transduction histidine kinase